MRAQADPRNSARSAQLSSSSPFPRRFIRGPLRILRLAVRDAVQVAGKLVPIRRFGGVNLVSQSKTIAVFVPCRIHGSDMFLYKVAGKFHLRKRSSLVWQQINTAQARSRDTHTT